MRPHSVAIITAETTAMTVLALGHEHMIYISFVLMATVATVEEAALNKTKGTLRHELGSFIRGKRVSMV